MESLHILVLSQSRVPGGSVGQPFDAVFLFLAQPVGKAYMAHVVILALFALFFLIGFVHDFRRKIDNGVRSVPVGSFQGHGSAGSTSGMIYQYQQVYRPFTRTVFQRFRGGVAMGLLLGIAGAMCVPLFGMILLGIITAIARFI